MAELRTGVGLAWRPETAWTLQRRTELSFTEVIAENLHQADLPAPVVQLARRGTAVVIHGVSLGLGGAERPCRTRLGHLAELARRLDAPFVSEHIAFVRGGGREAGHLLPIPRTEACLEILVENINEAAERLPVPLAVENIASLVSWPSEEFTEVELLNEVVRRTPALLLVDVANLYANARNHGWDWRSYLDALPLDRVAYVHVAGGIQCGRLYHDTHAHPVAPGPLQVLHELARRATLPVLLEKDGNFGTRQELDAELAAVLAAVQTVGARHVA